MNSTAIAVVKSIAVATESSPWFEADGQEVFGVFVESETLGIYDACHFTGPWRACRDQARRWNDEHAAGKTVRLPAGILLYA